MPRQLLALQIALLTLTGAAALTVVSSVAGARQSLSRSFRSRRSQLAQDREEGAVTLEQVVITLGLLLIATAVVAGLTLAITNRLNLIK